MAEFAALLRELKERTDRSYGSLARRLNMNTSTLHRYCAGEAVPVDFAPVERFAALCGASSTERLDLHRRWLRAAEARRHPRGADGGSAGAAGSAPAGPGPGPGSAPDSGSAPGPNSSSDSGSGPATGPDSGSGSRSVSNSGPASGPDSGPDSGPGSDSGSGSRSVSNSGPDSGPDSGPGSDSGSGSNSGSASGPGSGSGSGTGSGPRSVPSWSSGGAVGGPEAGPGTGRAGAGAGESAPAGDPVAEGGAVSGPRAEEAGGQRPWYRRRERVAVAVAAACALLATVGSLSALPDDRRSSGGRETSGARPGTSAPTGTAAKPHGRTSSPAPSATASGTGTGTAAPKGRPGAPESPRGTSAPPEPTASAGPPPLTWSADSHVWAYGCGHDYVVARPPKQVPPPPAPQDARTWAEAQSAVHGGETRVELSVQGTSRTAVVLTALRVRVTGRAAPAPGNAYAMDEGCGGALTPRHFDVDLDKDRPIARAVAGNDAGTPIPAVRMPYRVSATDPEVLMVTARTGDCDCRWYLELDWSSQGRTGTVRIDDHGRPFRTSGVEELPRYAYDTSARDWRPRTE
ncbi:helix-turn-helix domain-containing protein [Streptomyces marokkonensis]|uniref:helix-turn-helix domain-containing protein n=1 Tax=Streptomyces marokkonensis TaxID=324855 RepID=UPI001FCB9D0F|nr:helix-turn-helix transcriptional regulator [Streptomyces marokkonensis]